MQVPTQSNYTGQYFFQLALDEPANFLSNFASELRQFTKAKYVVVGLCSTLCKTLHARAVASDSSPVSIRPSLHMAEFPDESCTFTQIVSDSLVFHFWDESTSGIPCSIEGFPAGGKRIFSTFILAEKDTRCDGNNKPVFFGQIFSDLPWDIPQDFALIVSEGWRGLNVAHRERLHRALDLTNRFSRFSSLGNTLNDVVEAIAASLPCEGVTYFIVAPSRQALRMIASTGFRWTHSPISLQHYVQGEGITGSVWNSGKPFCTINSESESSAILKSTEVVTHSSKHFALWYPVCSADGPEVMGVIRCRNRIGNFGVSGFSDFDFDVVKWISDATKSIFEILYEDAASNAALGWLSHELKLALGPIKTAAVEIEQLKQNNGALKSDSQFVIATVNEMTRAIKNTDLLRKWPAKIVSKRNLTHIGVDIIPRVLDNVQSLLNRYGIDKGRIYVDPSIGNAPICRVDREQLIHATANILANAITYCYSRPTNLQIRIYFEVLPMVARLIVEDWGIGFDPARIDSYFVAGMRHPDAHRFTDTGQGLGLWCARWLIRNIGGDVSVDNCANPTRVAVSIPLARAVS